MKENTKQIKIFISYSRRDKYFVTKLKKSLESFNFKVWLDEANIKVGESLYERIFNAIKTTDYTLVVLSPNFIKSNFAKEEIEAAFTLQLKNRKRKLIPILLEDCKIPLYLKSKLYIDFTKRKFFDASFKKLVKDLSPDDFERKIFECISEGINSEFESYKKLPIVDTSKLKGFYFPDRSAYKRIYHLLKRHQKRGWVISNKNNPSTVELLEIELYSLKHNKVQVQTKEYWYLRWYDVSLKKYKQIYDKENKQLYVLEKNKKGSWKIAVNQYR
jgi:hypothetical protein